MRRLGYALLGVTLFFVFNASSAELNAFGDDKIEVYLNGNLVTFPKRTEIGKETEDTTAVAVDLLEGTNCIAIKLTNLKDTVSFFL